jgi:hypothetical protein
MTISGQKRVSLERRNKFGQMDLLFERARAVSGARHPMRSTERRSKAWMMPWPPMPLLS